MRGTLTVTVSAASFKAQPEPAKLLREIQRNSQRANQAEALVGMLTQAGFQIEPLQGLGQREELVYRLQKDYPGVAQAEQEIFALIPRPPGTGVQISFTDQNGNTLLQGKLETAGQCAKCGNRRLLSPDGVCRSCRQAD